VSASVRRAQRLRICSIAVERTARLTAVATSARYLWLQALRSLDRPGTQAPRCTRLDAVRVPIASRTSFARQAPRFQKVVLINTDLCEVVALGRCRLLKL